ncbi:hypothetical protein K373_06051 [Streptomyces sp. DvalAA-21]|nr:hypothetical protein SACTE_2824 [Streptomyces sp. SirexAA-E]PZX31519.1 hypothetical protein K373_06051 [Streptomyces sp. DvalAA-21]RAJ28274.1 hypothetical protein K351_05879 [Streptomyces sp. DpondAA-E10]RAJ41989.1 hypothetical protein K352_05870 [Streptomyces sp. DpondAA-A50]SCD74217.1 hypothetical protein GA0115239_107032 [Streptomyces sp. BpilaLS-43]SCE27010.1 hypothetical protein GA0115235_11591 [Streptomyces sp. DpondAA-F4a]SCL87850.1 hypothetical protein SAMN04883147_102830 [Streptom
MSEGSPRGRNAGLATLGNMDYVSALVPPVVMAVFFIALVTVIIKSQGGPNKAKEDAAVDAALARAESAQQAPRTDGV